VGKAIGILILFFPLFFSCHVLTEKKRSQGEVLGNGSHQDQEQIMATVDGVSITSQHVKGMERELLPQFSGHQHLSDERMGVVKKRALVDLIQKELIFQEGKRLGIKVSLEEISHEVSKIENRFPSAKAFDERLVLENLTENEIHRGVERFLLIQKTLQQEIEKKISFDEEDLEHYYRDHPEKFVLPEQIRIRQILLGVLPSASTEDWENTQQTAMKLVQKINEGEDFEALAQVYSDDGQTRDKGGDLGWVHRGQMSLREVEEIAYRLKVGETSDPIRTLYGYFIIRVEEVMPQRQLQYLEINKGLLKEELKRSAIERRKEKWLKGLQEKTEIKLFIPQ
jgi:peptidyl-prolyl cis-trans isomerase C